jgi:hypothetical protein
MPGANNFEGRQLGKSSIDELAAGVLAALLAVPSPLSISMSWGGAVTLMIAPVTLPVLWSDKRGRWLIIALLALVPSGWLVAQISLLQDSGRSLNSGVFLYQAALPVGFIAGLVGAYWCITKLGTQRFLLVYFSSLFAAMWIFVINENFHQNIWKFGIAVPVSMLVILLLARNRLLLGLVITPLLIAVSIFADFRSGAGFLALAAILTVFRNARWKKPSASKVAWLGLIAVMAGSAIIWVTAEAATAGTLGTYLQERTKTQLEDSNGNLLLGGRPEWGAATALWRDNPLGIGIGVAPSSDDYWLAITNMPLRTLGEQQNSGVAFYFQHGQVDFHSTFWTFWGVYGPAGIAFAALAVVYAVRAMMTATTTIKGVNLRASVTLLMLFFIWDIFFSPAAVPQLAVALAIALQTLRNPNVTPNRAEDSTHERSSVH